MATILATILSAASNTADAITGRKKQVINPEEYHDAIRRGGVLTRPGGYQINSSAAPLVGIGFKNGLSTVDEQGSAQATTMTKAPRERRVSPHQGVSDGSAVDATQAGVRMEAARQAHVKAAQRAFNTHTSRLIIQ